MNIYETQRLVDEYLLFHFGADDEVLPWSFGPKEALGFARRTVTELLDHSLLSVAPAARALDLGCAVGRSAYELAQSCSKVIAMDYSRAFVEAAEQVQSMGEMSYSRLDEGNFRTNLVARRPADAPYDRIHFEQGDAMCLPADLGSFDVVHAANLLCRLGEPQLLLNRLPELVKPGGQLLLTTPCTWLEEFTPARFLAHGFHF